MLPIRQHVLLSGGSVTLKAWGADTIDARLTDLLTLTATLGLMREQWQEFKRGDVEPEVWASFWRLVAASLHDCTLPQRLTWDDRLTLLTTLWELNHMEAAEGKLNAISARAARLMAKFQGQMTISTASSSAPSGQNGTPTSSHGLFA
jgi:hypothetical protein